MSKTPMIGTDSSAPSLRRSTSVRSCITTPWSLICRCTMKSMPSSLAKNSAMNSLMASRPSTEGVGGMLRYTASSVKQLAISSRSGLDHSAQNLVTTSSGERVMPRWNAPAQTDISSPSGKPQAGVKGSRTGPTLWELHKCNSWGGLVHASAVCAAMATRQPATRARRAKEATKWRWSSG